MIFQNEQPLHIRTQSWLDKRTELFTVLFVLSAQAVEERDYSQTPATQQDWSCWGGKVTIVVVESSSSVVIIISSTGTSNSSN